MLTRREFIALPCVYPLVSGFGVEKSAGPGVMYREYSRCLPDFLRDQAERAYTLRNREIAKLATPAAIRDRQRWVTKTFWQLVGGMPERTPLNARTVGSFARSGYRVEKVLYESQPDFHVPANLYIPTTGSPPYPGVLFQMGHTVNGKAGDLYQRCCQGLALLGYVVLAFDPMGQGERTYYPGASPSRSRLGADEEHTYPGRQMLLKGITSTRLQVWDSVRSLDYLASHPLVDPKRLASTGQSGGGTTTMFLMAVDDRLAAAAVACGDTENVACANFNPPGSTDDAEQNLVGSGPAGFDRWDLLYPHASKPLLVLASDKDFFGTYSPNYIANGWAEFLKLQKIYETLGHRDRIAWYGTPLPHGLAYDMRLQIYNWFERWLKGGTKPVEEEPPVAPESDETLFVAPSGSVVQSFHGETPFTLNKKLPLVREPSPMDRFLGVERPPSSLRAATLARTSFRKVWVEAVEFQAAPRVWVPAWLFYPKQEDRSKPVVTVLEPGGRASWHEGEFLDRLASEGCVVCAPDLRGIGDLTPEFGRGAARYARSHNTEEDYAWSSLILGKPLLGQRVTDILAVVQGLRSRPDLSSRRRIIAARGILTVPAQFAASLETGIDALYLAEGLSSFQSVVDTENYHYPFENFVPDLLKHTDLPELAESIAPRRIILAGAVDAAGKKLSTAEVQSAYKGAPNVEALQEALWEPAAILRLCT